MSEELNPVRCGCGGEAKVDTQPLFGCYVMCGNCGMRTRLFINRAKAITAWNRAVGERTAKVVEHEMIITDTDGCSYHRTEYLCGNCKKKVISGDEYCSHCGARLEWE